MKVANAVYLISGGAIKVKGNESMEGSLKRWRLLDRGVLEQVDHISTGQVGPILTLLWMSNGNLISGGADGSLGVWRSKDSELVKVEQQKACRGNVSDSNRKAQNISSEQQTVISLVEVKPGLMISGGGDGSLRLWQFDANGCLRHSGPKISTSQGWVRSMVQIGVGVVISGGFDGSLRVWQLHDNKTLKPARDGTPIPTQQGEVFSLLALANDKGLISGGEDGTLLSISEPESNELCKSRWKAILQAKQLNTKWGQNQQSCK